MTSYLTPSKKPFTDKNGHLTKAFQMEKHDTASHLLKEYANRNWSKKCVVYKNFQIRDLIWISAYQRFEIWGEIFGDMIYISLSYQFITGHWDLARCYSSHYTISINGCWNIYGTALIKPATHKPSWRPVVTGPSWRVLRHTARPDGRRDGRHDGPSWRLVCPRTRCVGPSVLQFLC